MCVGGEGDAYVRVYMYGCGRKKEGREMWCVWIVTNTLSSCLLLWTLATPDMYWFRGQSKSNTSSYSLICLYHWHFSAGPPGA